MSILHLSTNLDCRVIRYGQYVCDVYAGKYSEITLNKGVHKFSFESVDNAEDSYEILYEMEAQDIETFLEIHLAEIRNRRLEKERESLRLQEIELQKQEEARKQAERIALEKQRHEEARLYVEKCKNDYKAGFVDLGLSVLWASSNLTYPGSHEPLGRVFKWGDVKSGFTNYPINYKYFKGLDQYDPNYSPLLIVDVLKYNNRDSLLELLPEDDAAYSILGSGYHIPTKGQWQELSMYCRKVPGEEDRIKGTYFISIKPGYEGQKIFLPYRYELDKYRFRDSKWVYNSYWSSSRQDDYDRKAFCAWVGAWGVDIRSLERYYALMIRPVKNKY